MPGDFDPYYTWLAIPPEEQPPDHYRLMGLRPFEDNVEVIQNAADRQMAHVRSFQTGPNAESSQRLLNEMSRARVCLLSAHRKAAYDHHLRLVMQARLAGVAPPPPPSGIFPSGTYQSGAYGAPPLGSGSHSLQNAPPQAPAPYRPNSYPSGAYGSGGYGSGGYGSGPQPPGPFPPSSQSPGPYNPNQSPGPYGPGPQNPGPYGPNPQSPGPYGLSPQNPGPYTPNPQNPGAYGPNPHASGQYGSGPYPSNPQPPAQYGSGPYASSPQQFPASAGAGPVFPYGSQAPQEPGSFGSGPQGSGSFGSGPLGMTTPNSSASPGGGTVPSGVSFLSQPAYPPANTQLGEYELIEKLGEGGMGAVYRAKHLRLGREVALKALSPVHLRDQKAIARFDREMRAVGAVDHPNVVRAMDAREIGGTRFLVMEYVDGMELSDVVRHVGPLAVADAAEIIRQAAAGLQAAHEHGLVHRDIKPSNLMVTRHGCVKLCDLGLARFAMDMGDEEVTGTGQAMGTPDYMAPEQVTDSRRVDIRADIYSLGCTFYKLLTGFAPFTGPEYRTAVQKLMAHSDKTPRPVGLIRKDVHPELAAVIDRMMAKSPKKRYATPAEVVDALSHFSMGSNLSALHARAKAMEHMPEGSGAHPSFASSYAQPSFPSHSSPHSSSGSRSLKSLIHEYRIPILVFVGAMLGVVIANALALWLFSPNAAVPQVAPAPTSKVESPASAPTEPAPSATPPGDQLPPATRVPADATSTTEESAPPRPPTNP